ncbi:RusA family crossover junction endodeoxyribonuclease [Brevibacillus sp. NRS-1366]|uniref:RusA family crossover junction endodeoxyribonuclease n=1 Tax=Brevibacillus sp. NRS-1366 TaxID=3233899 RepID=UPI003D1D982E
MKLNLTLPLPVSINKLYINQGRFNPALKRMVPTGKRILSPEGAELKERIQIDAWNQMKDQDWDYDFTKDHYIYMDTRIYFNRKGRDDNNIYKLNNDALEKIVYDNDSRVLTRTQRILYSPHNPRIELLFTPVPFVGIFDDVESFKDFESRCNSCKKYLKGRCSILKKAIEGFEQEEINQSNCLKYKK